MSNQDPPIGAALLSAALLGGFLIVVVIIVGAWMAMDTPGDTSSIPDWALW